MATSRKDLLVGAAAASLSTLWGCGSHAFVPLTAEPNGSPNLFSEAKTDYDVIIVGAGTAGIAAARAVRSARASVLVLEAQDHIGGRCYTRTEFPVPFDQGAQFVGQAQSLKNFLYPLMRQRGIKLIEGESIKRYFYDPATGKGPVDYTELVDTYAEVVTALLTSGLGMSLGDPDKSALDVVKSYDLQNAPYLKPVFDFLISAVDAGDPKDQSTLDLYNVLEYIVAPFNFPPRDTFLIPSGYGAFVASLAKDLPIRKNSPVESIDYRDKLVTVKTVDKRTYTAKAVIVTASINVLKSGSLKLIPELGDEHAKALSGITMGHGWKGMFEFKGKPFVGRLKHVPPDRTASVFPLVNESIPQIFVNYFAETFRGLSNSYMMVIAEGELAIKLEKMGGTKAGAFLCAMLEKPFPGIASTWTGRFEVSDWLENPYTLGCISYATVGNAGGRVELSKPVGNKLFFAGEAISVHSHSLVNGAWATGTDAGYGALFAIGVLDKRRLEQLRQTG